MSCELYHLCGFDMDNAPHCQHILIREGMNHDATFAVVQLMDHFLKKGNSIYFISLCQTLNHYVSIAQKLAVNLTLYKESKQFTFFDGIKFLSVQFITPSEDCMNHCCGSYSGLKELYVQVSDEWNETTIKDSSCPLLIVDDLTVLEDLGWKDCQIHCLVQYLKELCFKRNGCLVTKMQVYPSETCLSSRISHHADVTLYIDSLKTGQCKEIDGEVVSIKKDLIGSGAGVRCKMHYKLEDKSVNYIADGTSTAVL